MAEKDPSARLRRAVKENNLFLVKRLTQRTDMRNIDPSPRRYTSLAWAAVMGHEETFEFLLAAGHDDDELSKDSENNTILMLLADTKPLTANSYAAQATTCDDISGATLRMARLYYDRYPWILDWSNVQGKTALHIAALKGNEELVRMLCDLGADFDLADNKGNTPLHYASSWGHIPVVQLLIERGCQFTARNNEGFTASDYAYSFSTRETLQDTARLAFENNKKARRNVFAQAAERGNEWGRSSPADMPPPVPPKPCAASSRMRSGSGTSRTTNPISESGEIDSNGSALGAYGRLSHSYSTSPPRQPAGNHSQAQHPYIHHTTQSGTSGTVPFSMSSATLSPPVNPASALSPIANRMRERDADAREKYLMRNRSGSQGTSSTDNRSQTGSNYSLAGPSGNGDNTSPFNHLPYNGTPTPRRLRPSVSAAQLRTPGDSVGTHNSPHTMQIQPESRHRAGTGPTTRPVHPSSSLFTRSSSTSTSPHQGVLENSESYMGPPSQYAQFPDPPESQASAPTTNRRKGFHLLSKPLPNIENTIHRRGMSAASSRGTS